jgi:hypothetical protein
MSSDTPKTDALWTTLMDACRVSGIAPANANQAFHNLDEFRTLERERNELRLSLQQVIEGLELRFGIYEAAYGWTHDHDLIIRARAVLAKVQP